MRGKRQNGLNNINDLIININKQARTNFQENLWLNIRAEKKIIPHRPYMRFLLLILQF